MITEVAGNVLGVILLKAELYADEIRFSVT